MQRPRVIRSVSTWEFMKINLVGTRTSYVHTPRDPPSAKTTIFCLGFMLLALCSSPPWLLIWRWLFQVRWEPYRSNYALTRTIADMEVHHTTTDLLFSTWKKDDCLAQLTTFADILGHLVLEFGEATVPVILRSQSSFKHICSSTRLRLSSIQGTFNWRPFFYPDFIQNYFFLKRMSHGAWTWFLLDKNKQRFCFSQVFGFDLRIPNMQI